MGSLLSLVLLAAPVQLTAGTLTLEVSAPETAGWFHVVDQLASWSPFSHRQFRDVLVGDGGLPAADEEALAAHAALRKKLGGYGVLDQAFYSDRSLEQALAWLGAEGKLSAADVAVERTVMNRLKDRVVPFLTSKRRVVDGYLERLKGAQAELKAFDEKAEGFFHCGPVTMRVFIIPSADPQRGGGGANGGILSVEVSERQPVLDVLLHESWHALGECKKPALQSAAASAGTDFETLSEGLAYAVSPGLWRMGGPDSDLLADTVRANAKLQKPFDDPYVRFNRLGLALRPSLEAALDSGIPFEHFLPIELAMLAGLTELADAESNTPPKFFCFGAECRPLAQAAAAKGSNAWSRPLEDGAVKSFAPAIRPRDTVLLLVGSAPVPDEARRLLGDDWPEVEAAMKKPRGLVTAIGRAHVTVCWGPDAAQRAAKSLSLTLP